MGTLRHFQFALDNKRSDTGLGNTTSAPRGGERTAAQMFCLPQAEGVLMHVFDNRSRVCG